MGYVVSTSNLPLRFLKSALKEGLIRHRDCGLETDPALGLWPVRTTPTFGQWLAGREDDDNAIGDLARDVASDVAAGCAAEPSTPEDCRTHVEDVHDAAGYVLDVVARAADEWRAAL